MIGEKIRKLRKSKGISQEALGETLGMTRQGVSYIEKSGSLLRLADISAALGVSPAYFFNDQPGGPSDGQGTP